MLAKNHPKKRECLPFPAELFHQLEDCRTGTHGWPGPARQPGTDPWSNTAGGTVRIPRDRCVWMSWHGQASPASWDCIFATQAAGLRLPATCKLVPARLHPHFGKPIQLGQPLSQAGGLLTPAICNFVPVRLQPILSTVPPPPPNLAAHPTGPTLPPSNSCVVPLVNIPLASQSGSQRQLSSGTSHKASNKSFGLRNVLLKLPAKICKIHQIYAKV